MEIKIFFKLILKWCWLLILIPLIASSIAIFISIYKTEPMYESSASILVVREGEDATIDDLYGAISIGQQTIRNYSGIIKSKSVLKESVNRLKLKNIPLGVLADNIDVVLGDRYSYILEVNVRNQSPELARDLANTVCDVFIEKIETIMQMQIVKILDSADLPTEPINDKTKKNVAVAAFGGFILAAALAFIIEYANSDIISNDDDVKKYLDLTVLGIIPVIKKQSRMIF